MSPVSKPLIQPVSVYDLLQHVCKQRNSATESRSFWDCRRVCRRLQRYLWLPSPVALHFLAARLCRLRTALPRALGASWVLMSQLKTQSTKKARQCGRRAVSSLRFARSDRLAELGGGGGGGRLRAGAAAAVHGCVRVPPPTVCRLPPSVYHPPHHA